MKYILFAINNVNDDIRELKFESNVKLDDLLDDNETKNLLQREGIEENNNEFWEHRKNDYGFRVIEINKIKSLISVSEYDYSYIFAIQGIIEGEECQKNSLELYLRRNY